MKTIHPIFERMESREIKEQLLGQRGVTLWFTGLSGSGKSTLAVAFERKLSSQGILCRILDGDNIRVGLNRDLGFSDADRNENIRRIAEVCRLFVDTGVVVIAAFISPREKFRSMARDIVGAERFIEIYLNTPIEECERRDVKGLYACARNGGVEHFSGIDSSYEPPRSPHLTLNTAECSVEECVEELSQSVLPVIKL